MRITKEYLMEHEPDLVEALWDEGRQEAATEPVTEESRIDAALVATIEARGADAVRNEAREEIEAKATAAERKRIQAILDLPAKGHDDLVAKAIDEGWDSGRTAEAILAAQGKKAQAHLDALKSDEEELEAPTAGSAPDEDGDSVASQTARILSAGKRRETAAH